jgi:hypothetical protein
MSIISSKTPSFLWNDTEEMTESYTWQISMWKRLYKKIPKDVAPYAPQNIWVILKQKEALRKPVNCYSSFQGISLVLISLCQRNIKVIYPTFIWLHWKNLPPSNKDLLVYSEVSVYFINIDFINICKKRLF